VRDSAWRDQGAGVLPDLGSHLIDTCRFWFGDIADQFEFIGVHCFENRARRSRHHPLRGRAAPLELEMTLLMWRNHFHVRHPGERVRHISNRSASGAFGVHPA